MRSLCGGIPNGDDGGHGEVVKEMVESFESSCGIMLPMWGDGDADFDDT